MIDSICIAAAWLFVILMVLFLAVVIKRMF